MSCVIGFVRGWHEGSGSPLQRHEDLAKRINSGRIYGIADPLTSSSSAVTKTCSSPFSSRSTKPVRPLCNPAKIGAMFSLKSECRGTTIMKLDILQLVDAVNMSNTLSCLPVELRQ